MIRHTKVEVQRPRTSNDTPLSEDHFGGFPLRNQRTRLSAVCRVGPGFTHRCHEQLRHTPHVKGDVHADCTLCPATGSGKRRIASSKSGTTTYRSLPIASGARFVATLFPARGLVPEPPGTGAPVDQIAANYGSHVDGHLTATYMWGIALMALLLFNRESLLRLARGWRWERNAVPPGTRQRNCRSRRDAGGPCGDRSNGDHCLRRGQSGGCAGTGRSCPHDRSPLCDTTGNIRCHGVHRFARAPGHVALARRPRDSTGLATVVGTAGIFEPESMVHNLGVLGLLGFVIWTLGMSNSLLYLRAPLHRAVQQQPAVV